MRDTHVLSNTYGATGQDSAVKRANKGHALPVECRESRKSVERKTEGDGHSRPVERRGSEKSAIAKEGQ